MNLIIVIVTVVVSLLAFSNHLVLSKLIFNPYSIKNFGQWYRFISSGFLHADFIHLLVNMFVLYSFGAAVENYYALVFGTAAYFLYPLMYLSSIFAANVSTYFKHQDDAHYNALGASGAVSAVLFTSILFNPYGRVLFYGFIEMPGIVMGVAYLGYSYYMAKRGSSDNINHDAHFYGAIYGILFTIIFKPTLLIHFFNELVNFR